MASSLARGARSRCTSGLFSFCPSLNPNPPLNNGHGRRFDLPPPSTSSITSDHILHALRHANPNSVLNSSVLHRSTLLEVLYRCVQVGNLALGQKFIDLLMNRPKLRHSPESLSAMIHVCFRNQRISDAQALILRMVRRRGASRSQIVDAMVSTYRNCGSSPLVFDLLIRTYVQARKLREASEALGMLKKKGFSISINACNGLLAGLVRAGWVEMAWGIYEEIAAVRGYYGCCFISYHGQEGKVASFKESVRTMKLETSAWRYQNSKFTLPLVYTTKRWKKSYNPLLGRF